MEILLIVLFLFIFFFLLSFYNKKIEKKDAELKQIKELQDTELRKRYEAEYLEEITQKKEGIEKLKKEAQNLSDQISTKRQEEWNLQLQIEEKQKFNASLFKIREDELNRLVEEKKKEKEATLEKEMSLLLHKKQQQIDEQYSQHLQQKELEKQAFQKQIDEVKQELDSFAERRAAINQAILRERAIEEAEDFYRIQVSQGDIEDIDVLNTILPRLRNKEILNKLIYESFIKRPLDELTKRIMENRDVSGIYKITYIKTGEAYIGRSTNIKRRWTEHTKSAFDIGTIAHSSFHDRLKKDGVWNYTFEILEEAPKESLPEKEKFYINIYGTDTQLNMKVG